MNNFKMKIKNYKIGISIFMLICLSSCWSGSDKITDKIAGTYAFEFPSGLYELLKIKNDSTFSQKYYTNYDSFKNGGESIYSSKGKWYKTSEYQLDFDNWLEYCDMSDPEIILPKPKHVNQGNVSWFKETLKNKALLSIYYENGYVFEKID